MPNPGLLRADIYKAGHLAARLTRHSDYSVHFAYLPGYTGEPLAWSLPLGIERVTPQSTLPNFFANLLPEGYRLNALAASLKTSKSNELGLLLALGADVPGDIQVVPAGEVPLEVPAVLVTDAESVSFHDLIGVVDRKSLPGVQAKLSARVSALMRTLPVNWNSEEALLKISPDRIPYLVENEFNRFLENKIPLSNEIEGVGKFLNNIKSFDEFKNILNSDVKAKIYFKDKKIKLATVLDLDFKDYDEVKEFSSYDEMINFYIDYEHTTTSYMLLKNRLESFLEKKLKKLNKILSLIKKDIEDSETMESIKEKGDILASVLYNVKKGMNSIKAYDFYNNEEIEIELDSLISPKENLDRIYKKYNKVKRGLTNAIRRDKEIREEISYIESTLLFIESSTDVSSLREIEEELIKLNYIKSLHNKKKTKLKKEVKYGVIEGEDYLILYGRNNLENDNLTFKISEKNDYWFHVKDIPSSHIILKATKLTDELIVKAAQVSAYYSKANLGEKVTVDYTLRKNVSKPNGAKPGFVIYVSQKSVVVEKVELDKI